MLRNCGFSLIELIAGLLILSILFLFCLPLGLSVFQNNHLEVVKDEISAAIYYARTRAALSNLPLILTSLSESEDWSAGMRLFVDNKKHQFTEKSELIHEWRWKHQGIHVNWQGLYSDHYLILAADLRHAAASGHFVIRNEQGKSINLTLNRLGRIKANIFERS